nr:hypothetical protein [Acetivibrio ethanolgignens]
MRYGKGLSFFDGEPFFERILVKLMKILTTHVATEASRINEMVDRMAELLRQEDE